MLGNRVGLIGDVVGMFEGFKVGFCVCFKVGLNDGCFERTNDGKL